MRHLGGPEVSHTAACRHAGDRNCCPLRSGWADASARRVWRRV